METPATHGDAPDVGWLPQGESFAVWHLAKLLGCHRSHLVHLIEQGELQAFDLRGKCSSRSTMRVPRTEVISFLQKRQVATITGKLSLLRNRSYQPNFRRKAAKPSKAQPSRETVESLHLHTKTKVAA